MGKRLWTGAQHALVVVVEQVALPYLLAAVTTHRIAKYTPLRRIAPGWKSWNMGWKFPMGLSLGGTLAIYLILGAVYGG